MFYMNYIQLSYFGEQQLKTVPTAQNNLFYRCFSSTYCNCSYANRQGNLQAGATHPCRLTTRNFLIRAKSNKKCSQYNIFERRFCYENIYVPD